MTLSPLPEPVAYPFNRPDCLDLSDAYEAARQTPGMIRVRLPFGEPAWLATRYADVKFVLGDRRFSRAEAFNHDEPRLSPSTIDSGLLSMDAPEHTRQRRLVAKAFTMHRVERLRPRVREIASGLLDELTPAGPPADLVAGFALPLPVAVIGALLGVPTADLPRFRGWIDAVMSNSLTTEEFETTRDTFRGYMSGLIAARRAAPADDLMTALIEARDQHDRLSELEMIDLCVGLLVAGYESTATQIANFVYTLLRDPDSWADLRKDPERIPAAVEELLRFIPFGIASAFSRYATEDVRIGDVLIRAGEPVLVSVSSANRDPRQFIAPEELRFDRDENQHVSFGHGAHHCLGAQLARLELQEALRTLLDRLPTLHIAGEIEWKTETFVRGPKVLPVGW